LTEKIKYLINFLFFRNYILIFLCAELIYRELMELVYNATYSKFSERIEDIFFLQIHAEKTLTASRLEHAPSHG